MKTTIEIQRADLVKLSAIITPRPDLGTNKVEIKFSTPSGTVVTFPALSIDCKREDGTADGPHVYQFATESNATAQDLSDDLDAVGIKFVTFQDRTFTRVSVNLMDLLDTHWMVFQMIDAAKLKITNGGGTDYYLDFHNDGTNLWASANCTGHDYADGMALIDALAEMGTKYEVQ
jgi:hypothetical protein